MAHGDGTLREATSGDGSKSTPAAARRSRRAKLRAPRRSPLLLILLAALLIAVPLAFGASQPHPGQKIDLRVLLVYNTGSEPEYQAWQAALGREGVPYTALQAGSVSDAAVADYAGNHAYYQAVILTTEATPLPTAASDAIAKLETTFGIRQLSDYTTTAGHGLTFGAGSTQIGKTGTLTSDGALAFPYLKGSVPIDPTAFAYTAIPDGTGQFTPLLVDSANNNSPYVGIYTHTDGRQEMVTTVNSNQFFINAQLLRHGMLNWVTRGVYLGYQRNYLEMQVDDLFLGDDIWNTTTHTTDYDPVHAIRMTPADLNRAVTWSNANKLRIDFVFNGGGSQQYSDANGGNDPLLTAVKANKGAFGFINHTWDHPNLDSATSAYIAKEVNDNVSWAQGQGLPIRPAELVTGEHSGLANSRPGNPGTIDPPSFATADTATTAGATLAAGTYDYAVTGTTSHGETVASMTQVAVAAPANSVSLTWSAVVHAATYKLYRSPAGLGTWSLIGTINQPVVAFDDNGPVAIPFTDTGSAGTPATLPTANTAAIDPYGQNPNLIAGLTSANVKYLASDASKTYPVDPLNIAGAQYPAGATFVDGPAQTVPRYPTNVYYNTATQAQQLDEYNWLYNASKGCVPSSVTTCNNGDITWAQYVDTQASIMFAHLMGNDPRPHYFHQTNLADSNQPTGAILYPVIDALLKRYGDDFNTTVAPLVQLTPTQIGDELARQAKWQADLAANRVSAYLLDGQVHVTTTQPMDVPLTGTTIGDKYAGQTSGWTSVAANTDSVFKPSDPVNTVAPTITGSAQAPGDVLTANPGTWTGTAPITLAYQWQRRDASGKYVDIPGATAATYTTTAADMGSVLRVAVFGSNWVSAVSQATSATGTVQAIQKIVPYVAGQSDPGRFDLSIDGIVRKASAGDGDSTAALIVGSGTHSIGAAAATGTSLADYAVAVACKDTATGHTGTVTADGATLSALTVGEGDQWQCTITATRKAGTIQLTQKVVPYPGQTDTPTFDLAIDGAVKKAGAGDGATTGPLTVGTGSHSVSAAAASGTSLDDYVIAIACNDAASGHTGTKSADGPALADLTVGQGDQWQCTITATHKAGTIQLTQKVVRYPGQADTPAFDLGIDGAVKKAGAGDGDTTGPVTVGSGPHSVTEAAGTSTSLGDYVVAIACKDTASGHTGVTTADGPSLSGLTVGQGDQWQCTMTATRKAGTIQLTQKVVPYGGQADSGRFDLSVDGAVRKPAAGDGDSTAAVSVGSGTHAVGAAAAGGTSLGDYATAVACKDTAAGHTGTKSAAGAALSGLTVGDGDQWQCTVTATRKPPASTGGGTPPPVATPLAIKRLSISPKRFAASGRRAGTTIAWRVSDGGTLRLVIQRVDSGRKIRGTCRATTRSNRAAKRCSRYLAVGAISRAVLKGDGTLRFTGRMRGRALRPGSYRLVAAIVGANGASSPSVARTFTVVASRR